MQLQQYIAKVINFENLTFDEAREAMDVIMRGDATDAQIGGYLTALRMKGETADEIGGSAASMRAHVVPVEVDRPQPLIDVVGTGGDGAGTFNISTTTAFVVAGAGRRVAKHGNRAASSKSGSADVLKALGGRLDLNAQQVAQCIEQVGIGFLYAVNHHPAMRYAIGPRRELAQRTIFNLLGPLTNPAGATHYLLGVFAANLTEPIAQSLGRLGADAAFVVHGAGGLDELSTLGASRVSHLHNGDVHTFDLDPETLGIDHSDMEAIRGGTPEENAAITRRILSGEERGAKRQIVLLNAAAALAVESGNFVAGLTEAAETVDSGRALKALEAWVELTNALAGDAQ